MSLLLRIIFLVSRAFKRLGPLDLASSALRAKLAGDDSHFWMRAVSAVCFAFVLSACGQKQSFHGTDITGAMPALSFSLTRANDGAAVTASDYRGKIAILYFGYTHCPDVCPTTLANLSDVMDKLGDKRRDVRILFVSVDPTRDTPAVLQSYVKAFAPEVEGLRGSDNTVAALARRYRVAYSVTPASPGHPYEVMHSDAVFFFDRTNRARIVVTSTDDVKAIAQDVAGLLR
jgi:protein SCO1/2